MLLLSIVNTTHLKMAYNQFFYRAASMQGGLGLISHERNVRPSVRVPVRLSVLPSVKRVNCEKVKETYAKIFTLYKRSFHLVF